MAQATSLDLNGVMGPIRSFIAKASPVVTPPDDSGLEYTLLGNPLHYGIAGNPLHYGIVGNPLHYWIDEGE